MYPLLYSPQIQFSFPFWKKTVLSSPLLFPSPPDFHQPLTLFIPFFFALAQHGQPSPDLHTPLKSSALANIRVAFGQALARELVELECSTAEDLVDGTSEGSQHSSGELVVNRLALLTPVDFSRPPYFSFVFFLASFCVFFFFP